MIATVSSTVVMPFVPLLCGSGGMAIPLPVVPPCGWSSPALPLGGRPTGLTRLFSTSANVFGVGMAGDAHSLFGAAIFLSTAHEASTPQASGTSWVERLVRRFTGGRGSAPVPTASLPPPSNGDATPSRRPSPTPPPAAAPTGEPIFTEGRKRIILTVPRGSFERVRSLFDGDHARAIISWANAQGVDAIVVRFRANGRVTVEGTKNGTQKVGSDLEWTSAEEFGRVLYYAYPLAGITADFDFHAARQSSGTDLVNYTGFPAIGLRAQDQAEARQIFLSSCLVPAVATALRDRRIPYDGDGALTFHERWSGSRIVVITGQGAFGVRVAGSVTTDITLHPIELGAPVVPWEDAFPGVDVTVANRRIGVDVGSFAELRAKVAAEGAAHIARKAADRIAVEERQETIERQARLDAVLFKVERQRFQDRLYPPNWSETGWTVPFPLSEDLPRYQPSEFELLLTAWKEAGRVARRKQVLDEIPEPPIADAMSGRSTFRHGPHSIAFDARARTFIVTSASDAPAENGRETEAFFVRAQGLVEQANRRRRADDDPIMVSPRRRGEGLEVRISHRNPITALGVLYEALTGRSLRDHPSAVTGADPIQPYQGEWGPALIAGEHLVAEATYQQAVRDISPSLRGRGTPFVPLRVTPWATLRNGTSRRTRAEGLGSVMEVTLLPQVTHRFEERVVGIRDYASHGVLASSGTMTRYRVTFADRWSGRFADERTFDVMASFLSSITPERPIADHGEAEARATFDSESAAGQARLTAAVEEAQRLEAIVRDWK